MVRSRALLFATCVSLATLASAVAQTAPVDASLAACSGERLSVYYARGEATVTKQSIEFIGHISDEASRCNPDGIDLVTNIDTSAEGGGREAVALALARLNSVAEVLIANGVPADRIRMAASPDADMMRPPMGEVGVSFRKSNVGAGEAAAPKLSPAPPQRPDNI
jgi:hypothetical protein